MSANRSSTGGQNGTASQLPKERLMMVFNFIHNLILILTLLVVFVNQRLVSKLELCCK